MFLFKTGEKLRSLRFRTGNVIMKFTTVVLFLELFAVPAFAGGPFYIDSTGGSDNNTGLSWDQAFKSLAKADSAKVILAGGASTVYLDGTFRETLLVPKDSLTYDGDSGRTGRTIITGSNVVEGWSLVLGKSYTYKNDIAINPRYVCFENEILLQNVSSVNAVEYTAGSFYWNSGILYLHTINGDNPAVNGKTYEAGARTECIIIGPEIVNTGRKNIIIQDLTVKNSAGEGGIRMGGIVMQGTNNLVQRVTSTYCWPHGLSFYNYCTNSVIQDCVIENSGSPFVMFGFSNCHDNTLRRTIFRNGIGAGTLSCLLMSHDNGGAGAPYNMTVENCEFYNDDLSTFKLIYCYGRYGHLLNGYVFRNNIFHGFSKSAIQFDYCTNAHIYNNVFYDINSDAKILCTFATDISLFNNTLYGLTSQFAVNLTNNSTGFTAKNNIIYSDKCVIVSGNSGTNSDFDFNNYFFTSIKPFTWGTIDYTFAKWKDNSGHDMNSLTADPLFVDPDHGDYRLKDTSPCIGSGIVEGASSSDILGIIRGTPPDLGAYENLRNNPLQPIQIISPDGGELWMEGTKQDISWTSSGIMNVKIECSKDNGLTWEIVAANVEASLGSFIWTVPNIDSNICIIKISDAYDQTSSDQSNSVFTIINYIGIEEDTAPKSFSLSQNYPNPFNPSTSISFTLPRSCHVSLKVYNVTGEKTAILVDDVLKSGIHSVVWTCGENASGIYFCTIQAGGFSQTRKMLLLR
jgi:hypothetical protein